MTAGSPVGYTLRFRVYDVEPTPMEQVTLRADGDLLGRATMKLGVVDDLNSTIDVSLARRRDPAVDAQDAIRPAAGVRARP